LHIFLKIFKYHISWNSVQWEPSCSLRTVRRTDKHEEANSSFSQFCDRAWKWVSLSGFAKNVITLKLPSR
jgi:ribonuclease HI